MAAPGAHDEAGAAAVAERASSSAESSVAATRPASDGVAVTATADAHIAADAAVSASSACAESACAREPAAAAGARSSSDCEVEPAAAVRASAEPPPAAKVEAEARNSRVDADAEAVGKAEVEAKDRREVDLETDGPCFANGGSTFNSAAAAAAAAPAGDEAVEAAASAGNLAARWLQLLLPGESVDSNGSGVDEASGDVGALLAQFRFSRWAQLRAEPNQRVIRADIERTRADVPHFRCPAVRDTMEAMLTCWCQRQGTRYKQGLNEVLALFVYLQSDAAASQRDGRALSNDEVFTCFSVFLRKFVPFYDSDDFVPLQCAFVFIGRLLLYHRPDLHNLLDDRGVSPEMYCMPWFLTLFASKTPLSLALALWDRLLLRGDPIFVTFLGVALLARAEQAVLSADPSCLPEILTSLGISSCDELDVVWSSAVRLRDATPMTFATRLRRHVVRSRAQARAATAASGSAGPEVDGAAGAEASAQRHQDEEAPASAANQTMFEKLEREKCFFILPEEVAGHCYCSRSQVDGAKRQSWQPAASCSWRLIVLDIRPRRLFDAERLPAALFFDPFAIAPPQAGGATAAGEGAWAAGKRLLQWSLEPAGNLDAAAVFDALKETLGEDWVCNEDTHICLLGTSDDPSLSRSLYEVLTKELTLRHVSLASGGYEAVAAFARKQGLETVRGSAEKSQTASSGAGTNLVAGVLANAGAVMGLDRSSSGPNTPDPKHIGENALLSSPGRAIDDLKLGQKFSSAWSNIRKAAAAGAAAASAAATAGVAGSGGAAADGSKGPRPATPPLQRRRGAANSSATTRSPSPSSSTYSTSSAGPALRSGRDGAATVGGAAGVAALPP
eukprot:TRINITY_DN23439_c0_g5_i1.p1 TRINITY_DN23439_c0_g5~~TRINITY_DN23439_c0_g5_i1.p1  ORF type:complete len:846 (-),score=199.53 TRINITY_DN23439_c0_g5_i1:5-2542(-)